jgi:hypothetical protein
MRAGRKKDDSRLVGRGKGCLLGVLGGIGNSRGWGFVPD